VPLVLYGGGNDGKAVPVSAPESAAPPPPSGPDVPLGDLLRAGAELGGYKFLGNTALLFGLKLTTSGVSAFIVQLSTILVPLLEAGLLRAPVPPITWVACLLSLSGVVAFAGEGLLAGNDAGLMAFYGNALSVVAAVCYSLQVLRLGAWAPRTPPIRLALIKVVFELLYNVLLIAVLVALNNPIGQTMADFVALASSGQIPWESWQGILTAAGWVGGISCAYTMWAQSFAQRTVRPVDANLIYASQPIWSAALGVALLGESISGYGFLGAALILSAVVLSITNQTRSSSPDH
jgi:drug/metabolite transporter (DMT)-like permease